MKKRGAFWIVLFLLLILLGGGTWLFITEVNDELWNSSVRTITESTHQGVNAINIQLEADFKLLEGIWKNILSSDLNKEALSLYWENTPDVMLYLKDQKELYEGTRLDRTVDVALSSATADRGLVDTHISSVTGEMVFNIFVRVFLADGTTAFLVKEYRTKEVADQFTLSFYNSNGFSYLVDQAGNVMVRPRHRNSNKTFSNLFDMISDQGNDPAMVEMFRESIKNRKNGWAKFYDRGIGIVFCYEPLRTDSGWLMVSIIPESMITKQATHILQKTMSLSVLAVGVILAFAATFFWIKLHENRIHTKELQEALERADTANQVKGQFLMDMSHDIRTPLNAIIGMTTIAEEQVADTAKVRDCLKKIKVSGSHLLSLVSDVLDMSQVEQGSVILKNEEFSFPGLLEDILTLMTPQAQEAGLTLQVAPICIEHTWAEGDPFRIRQILVNIIGNAVKYTLSGGQIFLELTEEKAVEDGYRTYRFCCRDTGIGMEPDFIKKVFLPFERARNTTASRIAGTGVGLAITKNLLDLMGGSISVKSKPGKGSVFTIELPLKVIKEKEPVVSDDFAAVEEETEEAKAEFYSSKRVLIVEDNELNMEIMGALMEMIGIQTEKAYNGQEAVNRLQEVAEGWFDLIFMDIQMPVLDGYEATRRIRRMEREDLKHIPIFAVSANALAEDVKNSLEAGMNGHISKPVDLDLLKKVMGECLK
ncbi:MAG: ATP-binding protein [Lachnospiraceae bacterium]|nr:ATP-binding protein [Lachnospiraceae bacterium]